MMQCEKSNRYGSCGVYDSVQAKLAASEYRITEKGCSFQGFIEVE